MKLMRLTPECVRLRRMAKAHAAGEMSEHEYRAARGELIDNFLSRPPEDDDTRRRGPDEPTLRSRPEGWQRSASFAPAAPTVDGLASGNEPWPGRRWMAFAVLALLLVVVVLGMPVAFAATLQVPPVRERNPDPAASPRGDVGAVTVVWGDVDTAGLPASTLEALQATATRTLDALRTSNAPGPTGFTPSELAEVGRFLNVLGAHQRDATLDAADARDLGALIRDQKSRRGVSVAELEEVARAVQSELRSAGYFLGVAYVPAQRVDDAVARIDVLPGTLGDIVVEGGDVRTVSGSFAALVGRPLRLDEVSAHLQALNALPGVSAQASFGPGDAVGESRLRLDLLERRAWSADVAMDNYGDAATGDQRLIASAAWLNPRGVGDRLGAAVLATLDPANQTYGYLDYETPLAGKYRASLRIGNNDFTDDVAGAGGDGLYLDVAARRSLLPGRARGLTAVAGLSRHELDWDGGIEQSVSMVNAGLAGHRVWDTSRVAADAALNLSLGHVGGDRFVGQDAEFWLLEMDAEAWLPLALLGGEQKLRLRSAGQWSDSLLPATRRFALGGAHRARGFERGAFLADRGILLGLEVRVPVGVGELLAFAESAYGDGRADGAETWMEFADVGLGWDAELAAGLVSRMSLALPVTARGTGGFDDDDARWYFSLTYHY